MALKGIYRLSDELHWDFKSVSGGFKFGGLARVLKAYREVSMRFRTFQMSFVGASRFSGCASHGLPGASEHFKLFQSP